jgi:hypothetical protein
MRFRQLPELRQAGCVGGQQRGQRSHAGFPDAALQEIEFLQLRDQVLVRLGLKANFLFQQIPLGAEAREVET